MGPKKRGAGEAQNARTSLRREWSRAYLVLLALLSLAAGSSIAGVHWVVGEVQTTAHRLNHETVTISMLRSDLVAHEETAHLLLSGDSVNRTAFLRQQARIESLFNVAIPEFPTTLGMQGTLKSTLRSWQSGLKQYGLWGNAVLRLDGNHELENPTFGASSDRTDALLDGLDTSALRASEDGLSRGDTLELGLMIGLSGVFLAALLVAAYFRRRMVRDLVRPVTNLRQGVISLQSGDFEHRIEVARHDELGELAAAFNDMARALLDGHTALAHRASHDPLTGLSNRSSMSELLTSSLTPGEPRASRVSVLFIDIDDFKDVNDSLGHEGGDLLLQDIAARLTHCVRPIDMVARLGGDEFAVLITEDNDDSAGSVAQQIAERILADMRKPFIVGNRELPVAVSIGVAHQQRDYVDAAELLRNADFAMYAAKAAGKNRYQAFEPEVQFL